MANTLTFANQTITDANLFGGISYIIDLNDGDEFSIGNTASASVEFITDIQLPLYSKDSVNGTFTWSKDSVSRGRYYITEVKKEDSKYTVTAYDAMILLETSIASLNLSFPVSVASVASQIATFMGCTVSGTVNNGALTVSALEEMPIRRLLGYVAEASGCSVKVDGSDHLCFVYYADSQTTITANDYKKINAADYTCSAIDKVTIFDSYGNMKAEAGTGTNTLYIQGNPFLDEATTTAAQTILNAVSSFAYRPLTVELFTDDGIEAGTIVTFGTTPTLVMHLESSEDGAVAESVGSDNRAEYNKSIDIVASEARVLAEAALETAEHTDQYFWMASTGTDPGVHITEIPRDDFLDDPQSGGNNLVATSDGIAVRDGTTELAVFGSAMRVGKSDSYHTEVDDDGFRLIDSSQTPVMDVAYSGEERQNERIAFDITIGNQKSTPRSISRTLPIDATKGATVTFTATDSEYTGLDSGTSTTWTDTFTVPTQPTSAQINLGSHYVVEISVYATTNPTLMRMIVEVSGYIPAITSMRFIATVTGTYYVPSLSFIGVASFNDDVFVQGKKITYDAGDAITNTIWYGTGFLTSSSTEIYFTLPIARIITATSATVTSLTITTRQNGSYTHGSSSSTRVEWTPISATITPSGVRIGASRATTTNAINNDVIGISAQISLEFS